MATRFLRLAALLLTMLLGILTLACLMARLAARMRTALECFTTDQTAKDIGPPARLILQRLLPAKAIPLGQEWTLGALFFFKVTIVRHLGVSTILGSGAWEIAWWRLCTAR